MRSIYKNILNQDTKLLDKLKNKTLKPQVVAFMSHQEMNPLIWKI